MENLDLNKITKALSSAIGDGGFSRFKAFVGKNYFHTRVINTKEVSDPIVEAIQSKEIPVVDPSEISDPIVEALSSLQETVHSKEGIEEVTIKNIEDARTDMSDVVSAIEKLIEKENQEIIVNPAKNDVTLDLKPVVEALGELKKAIPKIEYPQVIDYTDKLSEIVSTMNGKTEIDYTGILSIILETLSIISSKEYPQTPPFKFDSFGKLEVNVDRAGGGSGGLNKEESDALVSLNSKVATSDNQLAQTTQSSEEALLLRRMLKLMESGGVNDFQGRQRVALDAITTALTLSIVTTVGNVNLIAGYNPLIEAMTASRNSYANSIRNNITFS